MYSKDSDAKIAFISMVTWTKGNVPSACKQGAMKAILSIPNARF